MDQALAELWRSLVTAGPVAMILGVVVYVQYRRVQALEERDEKRQDQMLRLAARVQRAVEALAGIDHDSTEVDNVLGGENGKDP